MNAWRRAWPAVVLLAGPALAEDGLPRGAPGPYVWTLDGFGAYQAPADLDGGGDLAIGRVFSGATFSRFDGPRDQIGLSFGVGRTWYEFGGGAETLWDDTRDARISLPIRFSASDRATVTFVPSVRFEAEDGADLADGQTEGAIAAITWRFSDRLTVGPGLGVFSTLDGDADVFPILAIDWAITPRLSLSTLRGVGASQGPGLSLAYDVNDGLSLGIAGRFESVQFRLDDDGPAPGGIGETEATPLVATLNYAPNPGITASAFAGVELDGTIRLRDEDGRQQERRDLDPAAVLGGQLTFRF